MKKVVGTLAQVIAIAGFWASSSSLYAQGFCIPKPLSVYAVKGRVLLEAAGRREPVPDVAVELSPYGYKKPALKKTITISEEGLI